MTRALFINQRKTLQSRETENKMPFDVWHAKHAYQCSKIWHHELHVHLYVRVLRRSNMHIETLGVVSFASLEFFATCPKQYYNNQPDRLEGGKHNKSKKKLMHEKNVRNDGLRMRFWWIRKCNPNASALQPLLHTHTKITKHLHIFVTY